MIARNSLIDENFFDERVQHKLLVYKLLNKKQTNIYYYGRKSNYSMTLKTRNESFHTDTNQQKDKTMYPDTIHQFQVK